MKSNTRHVEGGVGNLRSMGISEKRMDNMRFEKNVDSTKRHKSKSISQSRGKRLRHQKHDPLMVALKTINLKTLVYEYVISTKGNLQRLCGLGCSRLN